MLFPFADPFYDKEVFSTLRFPPLPVPPGFAPIRQPGSLRGTSDIVLRDLSIFQPGSLSQLGPLPTGWAQPVVPDTGVVDDMLPSVVSLIILRWNRLWPEYKFRWCRLIQTMIIFIWGLCSTDHFTSRCSIPRCSRTALFIVKLVV